MTNLIAPYNLSNTYNCKLGRDYTRYTNYPYPWRIKILLHVHDNYRNNNVYVIAKQHHSLNLIVRTDSIYCYKVNKQILSPIEGRE